jgi:hypothetical protein
MSLMIALAVFGATASKLVGVAHDPDSVPLVRCANGSSGYAMPFRIVPERREAAEDFVQSSSAKGCNILNDDVLRSRFFNEPVEFVPKTGSFARKAGSESGNADVLARESSAYNVNCFMDIFR